MLTRTTVPWFMCRRGYGSRDFYLMGRSPFIDRPGVPQLEYSYFTTWVNLHDEWGPRLKISGCRACGRLPDRLLGSRASSLLVPKIVLRVATVSLYFSWLLKFTKWGLIWMG
jgi:hypothetical protein